MEVDMKIKPNERRWANYTDTIMRMRLKFLNLIEKGET
jgi:hypothetical protein